MTGRYRHFMALTFQDLQSLGFARMETCSRCSHLQTLDWRLHPDYGTLPYSECPKCKQSGIYPWGIFFFVSQANKIRLSQKM